MYYLSNYLRNRGHYCPLRFTNFNRPILATSAAGYDAYQGFSGVAGVAGGA
jgi:hypothetical protein